jgi:hypothetical protein
MIQWYCVGFEVCCPCPNLSERQHWRLKTRFVLHAR